MNKQPSAGANNDKPRAEHVLEERVVADLYGAVVVGERARVLSVGRERIADLDAQRVRLQSES